MGFDIRKAVGGVVDAGRNLVEQGRDLVEQGVQHGLEQGRNLVDQGRDAFDGAVDRVEGVVDFVRGRSDDRKFDGHHVYPDGSTRAPGSPLERDPSKPLVLHVNGISNDVASQTDALQAVQANAPDAQVIGIHNATEGTLRDLGQAGLDTINKGNNPAVDSLADTMYEELEAGRPVHVMAHSQGALITSRALEQVKQRLMLEGGMTSDQAQAAMNDIRVETFGGAAPSFTDGPQYVHYVNRADPVPVALGLGPGIPGVGDPGAGAQVHHFTDPAGGDFHSFNTTYLDRRVPFDQARTGDFTQRDENRL